MKRWAFRIALLALLPFFGCKREEQKPAPRAASAAPAPATPDRLPAGELLEGEVRAFGLPLPRRMTLEASTRRTMHARGEVGLELLGDYIRQRVLVRHVEMAAGRLVFPEVYLKGDPQRSVLRIELIDEGVTTHLIVQNVTGPPKIEGLSEEERWKRAGMTPSGQLIDQQNLE